MKLIPQVARKNEKDETKTNKRQCPLVQYRFKICEGSPEEIRMTTEERICERDEF